MLETFHILYYLCVYVYVCACLLWCTGSCQKTACGNLLSFPQVAPQSNSGLQVCSSILPTEPLAILYSKLPCHHLVLYIRYGFTYFRQGLMYPRLVIAEDLEPLIPWPPCPKSSARKSLRWPSSAPLFPMLHSHSNLPHPFLSLRRCERCPSNSRVEEHVIP